MPLLVRALANEQLPADTELTPLGPQTIAQRGLLSIEMFGAPIGEHAQPLDRRTSGSLRGAPPNDDRRLELPAEGGGKDPHRLGSQRITVFSASRCGCTCARRSSRYAFRSSGVFKVADGRVTRTLSG